VEEELVGAVEELVVVEILVRGNLRLGFQLRQYRQNLCRVEMGGGAVVVVVAEVGVVVEEEQAGVVEGMEVEVETLPQVLEFAGAQSLVEVDE